MKKLSILFLIALAGCKPPDNTINITEPSLCYEIIEPETDPLILLNKCTGDSWGMIREPMLDENGVKDGGFNRVWNPLDKFIKPQSYYSEYLDEREVKEN